MGNPNELWKVALPAKDVPLEHPGAGDLIQTQILDTALSTY